MVHDRNTIFSPALDHAFAVLEVGTRRILHWNVTEPPTARLDGTAVSEIAVGNQPHRFVIHDRDTIYGEGVDRTVAAMDPSVMGLS